MEKILSIVIPTYNMEKYLNKCIDSLLIPDLNLLDILIINDGSKDSSSAIGHEYESRFPESIHIIDKENGNYGSCVNRGLKEAKGRYFRLLDADDSLDTNSLQQIVKILKNLDNEIDVMITNYSIVDIHGNVTDHIKPLKKIKNNVIYNFEDLDLYTIYGSYIGMHACIYNTMLLRSINLKLDTGISYTDLEFQFFPAREAKTILFSDIDLYRYLRGREGQTVDSYFINSHLMDYFKIRDRLFPIYEKDKFKLSKHRMNIERSVLECLTIAVFRAVLLNKTKVKNSAVEKELRKTYTMISKDQEIKRTLRNYFGHMPVIFFWHYLHLYWGHHPILFKIHKKIHSLRK